MPPFVTIAAYAPTGVGILGAGIVSEVFDERGPGLPRFDFALCTDRPGRVRSDAGVPITVEHGLERLASADLVIALPWADFRT
ncbi:MAG: AraC family transcriptional regulator, partial [Streptomyces sp.]